MFRRDDEIALIVPIGDFYSLRNLFPDFAQLGFNAPRDFDGVAGRLLVNLEKHSVVAVGRHSHPLRLGRMFDGCDVIEQNHAVGI